MPGDVVVLSAGATAPGRLPRCSTSRDLFADEATLTGETFPAEKAVGVLPAETPLAQADQLSSSSARTSFPAPRTALVVAIGKDTEFGKVSERLKLRPPETDFERGIRRFGYLLMEVTLLLVICIFAFNVYLHRPVLDSFLFSLALAVGLTPQLLPAIVSINLAAGARRMAAEEGDRQAPVVDRELRQHERAVHRQDRNADRRRSHAAGGPMTSTAGESATALLCVYLNATFESGFASPIDAAVRKHCVLDIAAWKKLDEVPYDFLQEAADRSRLRPRRAT